MMNVKNIKEKQIEEIQSLKVRRECNWDDMLSFKLYSKFQVTLEAYYDMEAPSYEKYKELVDQLKKAEEGSIVEFFNINPGNPIACAPSSAAFSALMASGAIFG